VLFRSGSNFRLGEEDENSKYAPELFITMETGRSTRTDVYTNFFGTLVSAFSAIKDKEGNVVAVVGADISVDEIFNTSTIIKFFLRLFSLIIISSAPPMLLLFFILNRIIGRPIHELINATKQISQGDLNVEFSIRSGDEFEVLGNSFKVMGTQLHNYMENLTEVTKEKVRINSELNIAKKIQSSMLPNVFPPYPNRHEFDIYATMIAANEVGGDFYDFALIGENKLAVIIADVSGKGVPGALFMVIASTLLKNQALYGYQPNEIFDKVNNILCEKNDANMFVTAFLGYLDLPSGKFTYVNAGHNPPLLKQTNGDFKLIPVVKNFVLGALPDTTYVQQEVYLSHGDIICLYTDGVTEAMNFRNELYGISRFLNKINDLKKLDVTDIVLNLIDDIVVFSEGAVQTDDIALLLLKVTTKKIAELVIDAKIDNYDFVKEFVSKVFEKVECEKKIQNHILIAVEEIFLNISKYAYPQEIGEVKIIIAINGEVSLEFQDNGPPFNPLVMEDPDLTIPAEEVEIGGLGIFLVKKIMDKVEYRKEDNKNILKIKKIIN
jgi:sigma-B regulation protein RsbU (phosphoserine phosphatase)